jgi:hypothetical protein
MVMMEETISNTKFKLDEATYFFDQMKNNLDNNNNNNKIHCMFNLVSYFILEQEDLL